MSMKVKEEMNRSKVSSKNDTKITYIHQLPEDVRIGLSSVLDADDSWKLLGKYVNFRIFHTIFYTACASLNFGFHTYF